MRTRLLSLKKLWLLTLAVAMVSFASAQSISGVVTGEGGGPLAGVSVSVKGTNTSVATNSNGQYSINAKNGAVLVFSFVGYTSREVVVNNSVINVRLVIGENVKLDEVVVVGYGTQKKADLTGAVSRVDAKQIENRPVTNALSALQGTVPGLVITRSYGQPGKEGGDATIRGYSSVNGSNSPLVLVDGVPGTLSILNPNDIESISVLKDAAAAAIYGADAANGVILVTTKSGKNQKMKVEYSGIFTTNTPFGVPQRNHSWVEAQQLNIARNNAGQSNVWSDAQLRWFQSSDTDYIKNVNGVAWDTYLDLDYSKQLIRKNTSSRQHNISVSGGSEKSNYAFSFGYYDQNGAFKFGPDSYKRINTRMTYNNQLSKIFSINTRVGYTNLNTLSAAGNLNGDYGLLYNIYQLRSIYPIFLPNNDGTTAGSYSTTKYFNGGINTYSILKDGGKRDEGLDLLDAVFTLKADVMKGLSFRAIYSPQLGVNTTDLFLRTIEYWNLPSTPVGWANRPNSMTKARSISNRTNIQFLGDYDYRYKQHSFHLLAGYQYNKNHSDGTTAGATNLISNDVASVNYPANQAINTPSVSDNVQTKVSISYFGRLNYNYESKYLLEATLRQDASSQLAPGHRVNLFPSVSAGWNIHKEAWFRRLTNAFSELKLRGSWGQLGNSSVLGNYDYISLLSKGGVYPFNNQLNNSIYQSAYASTEKSWEVIETSDIGLDIGMFRNKLTGSFDYFVRQNKNMLVSPTLPAIFGISPSQQNIADLKTWGWEVEMKWRDRIGKANYFASFNISDAKNKIVRYNGNNVYGSGVRGIIEGLPINTIWGYKNAGYFQTAAEVSSSAFQDSRTGAGDIKYIDLNHDNKINGGSNSKADHGDLVNLGEITPHYSYGFTLGFDVKGFDFSVFFQGVLQRKMLIYSYAALPYMESWRQSWQFQNDYWTPENPNARFPRLYLGGTHNTAVSDFWVQNANYIRLKNLQVGYTLPVSLTSKAKISKLRIYFTGQDMWEKTGMWMKYYDPENPNGASFGYPFFRSYAVGVNLTF